MQHPNLEPIVEINSGKDSTLIIQPFNDRNMSLRDFIYGVVWPRREEEDIISIKLTKRST